MDGEKGGRGYGGGGKGRLYTYRYSVTTRMTPAFKWAAMRAILIFINCETKSRNSVSQSFRRERRAESDSNRGPSVYQPNALPLGQSGSPFPSPTVGTYRHKGLLRLITCALFLTDSPPTPLPLLPFKFLTPLSLFPLDLQKKVTRVIVLFTAEHRNCRLTWKKAE